MGKHDSLTSYIDDIESASSFGTWVVDRESKGTHDDPITMPYVNFDPMVSRFLSDFYEEDYPDYSYGETLDAAGIEDKFNFDTSDADERIVTALLTHVIRMDRFCEGALLEAFEDGTILRWLKRLREIDEEGEGL